MAREEIRKELEGILDLERLTSRMTLGTVTPRDLLALRGSLEKIPRVRELSQVQRSVEEAKQDRGRTTTASGDPRSAAQRCASRWTKWRTCAT